MRRLTMNAVMVVLGAVMQGCGGGQDSEAASVSELGQTDSALTVQGAVAVKATWWLVFVRTPNISDNGLATSLSIEVSVDDQALRSQVPSFDGLERVVVLVPEQTVNGVAWRSHALDFSHEARAGYFGEKRMDVHSGVILLEKTPTALLETAGVAVALDTNAGRWWAQSAGKNYRVTRAE